ncbi:unnamed protein product [Ilex paraguariensis]|uniref:SHSP domain-containing protein n=1 Tax=Ilex paraguariensis TaxID=185542 RepID=A0ABC8RDK9_9AQUA
MAERPPRTIPRSSQAPVLPVYEDFKPISMWKQEEESDILLIYLPGFMKNQIKVTTEGRNIVRVSGERLIAGNKWNSFVQDFQVPEYCNIRGIRAKFEVGILTVTMPKKSTSIPQPQVDPKVEGKTTQEVPPTPKDPKIQEDIPPKPSSSTTETKNQMDAANEPKSQKGIAEIIPKYSVPPLSRSQKIRSDREPEKGQGEQPPARPTTSGTNTDKQKNIDRDDQSRERKETTETTGVKEMMRSSEKGKEPLKPENEVKPISEREKQVGDGSGSGYKEEGVKHISKTKAEETTKVTDSGAGAGAVAGARGYNLESKVVKGLVKELDEERQLMVNVGVAVLVIVALGAYVYFTYGSSRKPQN